jgi:hypothetical protein
MKERMSPSTKLKRARYTGMLYTHLKVPNAVQIDGWYYTDADSLRKYVFSRLWVEEFDYHAKQKYSDKRPVGGRSPFRIPRTSKDHFEVFIPANSGRLSNV